MISRHREQAWGDPGDQAVPRGDQGVPRGDPGDHSSMGQLHKQETCQVLLADQGRCPSLPLAGVVRKDVRVTYV